MSGEALRVVTCGRLLAVVGDMSAPPAVTSTRSASTTGRSAA